MFPVPPARARYHLNSTSTSSCGSSTRLTSCLSSCTAPAPPSVAEARVVAASRARAIMAVAYSSCREHLGFQPVQKTPTIHLS